MAHRHPAGRRSVAAPVLRTSVAVPVPIVVAEIPPVARQDAPPARPLMTMTTVDAPTIERDMFLRRHFVRVSDGTRTRDRLDHNQELYQLSYAHQGGRP